MENDEIKQYITSVNGYYIKDEKARDDIETIENNKANKSTTLEGYGITDAYTKSEINASLNNMNDKFSMATVDGKITNVDSENSYVKLDYPTGFSSSNCAIIGGKVREKFSENGDFNNWHTINFVMTDTTTVGKVTFNDLISIENDGIYYVYNNLISTFILPEIEVELYLMKINRESESE